MSSSANFLQRFEGKQKIFIITNFSEKLHIINSVSWKFLNFKYTHFSAAGRPAFEVIDSLVNAVGSVSMLLDSTHSTVFSLFRSVIGVIDEFSRLRSHFSSLFTAFALTKMLR